jgi:hypothetical protein
MTSLTVPRSIEDGPRGLTCRAYTAKSDHRTSWPLSRTAPLTTMPAIPLNRAAEELADHGRVVAPARLDHDHVPGARDRVVDGAVIRPLARGGHDAADEPAVSRKGSQGSDGRIDEGEASEDVGCDTRRHLRPPPDELARQRRGCRSMNPGRHGRSRSLANGTMMEAAVAASGVTAATA